MSAFLSPFEILSRLQTIRERRTPVGFDSEGEAWPTCLGFATSRTDAFVVDTLALQRHPQAKLIWEGMRAVLEDPHVVKYCWNAAHERAFLQHALGWILRNYEDGMFAWHGLWPELPSNLKYAASVLTRIPCWTEGISWKEDDERPAASGPLLWRYNAWDDVATLQLCTHPQLQLTGVARDLYHLNLNLIEPFHYASQKGVLYDSAAAETLRATITPQLWEAQAKVDQIAGISIPEGEALLAYARENCCAKRKRAQVCDFATAVSYALKDYADALQRVADLVARGDRSPAALGEIGSLLDIGLNVKSTKQVTACLNRLGLPAVYKPGKRKVNHDTPDAAASTTPSQSKDAATLLALFLRTGHEITTALLSAIALRDRLKELKRGVDKDGRIRSSYIICGPETDRTASHKWLTGSGGNAQTIPKEPVNFRVCYVADPGYCWFKLDLTGADLWTVAARVAAEGDRTLLDDLRAGIRIPSLVGLLMEGYKPGTDRAIIKADCVAYRASLKARGESWKDTVWKKSSHLTNYGGSAKRIRQSVIEDTYAETGQPIDPGLELCQRVQRLYLARYWGLPKWWSRTATTIMRNGGRLTYATGRVREFLARRPSGGKLDDATLREALAAEPQHNTTYVIKIGVQRLWGDPENWPSGVAGEGDPIVQALIPCVHDECTGQFPIERRQWAVRKLREWFTVELTIAGERVIFPFDGATGANWGACKDAL